MLTIDNYVSSILHQPIAPSAPSTRHKWFVLAFSDFAVLFFLCQGHWMASEKLSASSCSSMTQWLLFGSKNDAFIWGFPKIMVPPNHPKFDHFSIETMGFGLLGNLQMISNVCLFRIFSSRSSSIPPSAELHRKKTSPACVFASRPDQGSEPLRR